MEPVEFWKKKKKREVINPNNTYERTASLTFWGFES
jgi:hypothetical protein